MAVRGRIENLVGYTRGSLKVVEDLGVIYTPKGHGDPNLRIHWVRCRCRCGKELVVRAGDLKRRTASCGTGCPHYPRRKPPGEAAFNMLYKQYRRGATERGLIFDLTKDEFKRLIDSSCLYCGSAPHKTTPYKQLDTQYTYTGVDRVNNSEGYTVENCVPCCYDCNYLKSYRDQATWLAHMASIVDHMRSKGLLK